MIRTLVCWKTEGKGVARNQYAPRPRADKTIMTVSNAYLQMMQVLLPDQPGLGHGEGRCVRVGRALPPWGPCRERGWEKQRGVGRKGIKEHFVFGRVLSALLSGQALHLITTAYPVISLHPLLTKPVYAITVLHVLEWQGLGASSWGRGEWIGCLREMSGWEQQAAGGVGRGAVLCCSMLCWVWWVCKCQ